MEKEFRSGKMSILDLSNICVQFEKDLILRDADPRDCYVIFASEEDKKVFKNKVDIVLGQREITKEYEVHILLS